MKQILDKIKNTIASKTRDQWTEAALELLTDIRIWVQENGEKAFAIGILAGVIAVVFFKFVIVSIVTIAVVALAAWYMAPEKLSTTSSNPPQ